MGTRSLTSGEIALAQSIFGNTINYGTVTINDHKYPPSLGLQPDNTVVAPNGSIYYPPAHPAYAADISTGTLYQRAFFIHEMTHVLQKQHGMNVIAERANDGDNDDYTNIFSGTPFHQLPMEAQADFLRDYYREKQDPDSTPYDESDFEEYLPSELPNGNPNADSLDDLKSPPIIGPNNDGSSVPGSSWLQGVLDGFSNAEGTPLVLDLDGDGVELTELNVGSIYWDIDLDGFGEASAWITGGDGLLAIDLDADGIINDHSELFGDQTGSPNGFAALAAYDTNTDSAITNADAQFGDLLVWIDANTDGYSQADELHTLNDLGITSISLNYSNVSYFINGNEIKQESSFVINGQTRDIVDAWFAYDNVNTEYVQEFTLDDRVMFLPNLRGYGNLPDLYIAMSLDETLLDLVQDLATASVSEVLSGTFDIETTLENILYRWAGVDGVSPTSRGAYIDARKLEFLEVLQDKEFQGTGANPLAAGAAFLEEAFQEALSNFATQMFAQTGLKPLLFDDAVYSPSTGDLETETPINIIWFLDDYTSINTSDIVNDLYFYSLGGGTVDNIHDAGGYDQILFGSDVAPEDVRLIKDGNNLDLFVGSDEIEIYNQFYPTGNQRVEIAKFSDGTVIDLVSNLTFTGTSAGEYIYGIYTDDDTLVGAGGNDTLFGEGGNDTYIYSLGDGSDTIRDSAGTADQIVFGAGIAVEDVRLWKNGNDLELYIGSDKVTLYNQFNLGDDYRVESAKFDDATVIDLVNNLTFSGTSLAETMYGTASDDILVGADGNDTLRGEGGNDTYAYSLGDGSDTIRDSSGLADQIVFDAGIAVEDVRLWKSGNDLELYIGSDKVTLYNQFNLGDDYQVESMRFSDDTVIDLVSNLTFTGTSLAETMYGTASDDILVGADGNDTLRGEGGNDTYAYSLGDGSDTIRDSSGLADQIVFDAGIAVEDVRLWKSGNDLELYIGSDKVTLYNQFNLGDDYQVETMRFSDDTVIDLVNNLTLTGTSVGEYMYGTVNDDVLYGAGGADNIYGYAGADTFAWLAEDIAGSVVDTLRDFSISEGDMLDISDVIEGYDPLTDAITDFVWMVNAGSNTDIYVDQDGAGTTEVWTKIATIQNVTGLTDEAALETNGTLIAA